MDMYGSSPVDTVCVYGIYSCKIVFVKYITQNLFFSLGNIFAVFFFYCTRNCIDIFSPKGNV